MTKTLSEALDMFRKWQTPCASAVEAERILRATEMYDAGAKDLKAAVPVQIMVNVYGRQLSDDNRRGLRDAIEEYYRNIVNKG